jgi:hypothetical protein
MWLLALPPTLGLSLNPFLRDILVADIWYYLILAGVGKTSLVHLIVKGSPVARPSQTIGCTVDVKVSIPH